MGFEKVIFTNICFVEKGDEVLVQQRTGVWPGIAFPGGHVKTGESFCDSVVREIFEESGLKLRTIRLCGVKSWYDNDSRYCIFLFRSDDFEGELIDSDEGHVFWTKKEDLLSLNISKGMEDLIEFYNGTYNEIYYKNTENEWKTELK